MKRINMMLAACLPVLLVIVASIPVAAPVLADGEPGTPGNVFTWGQNFNGQMGLPEEIPYNYLPIQVSSLNNIIAVSAGSAATLAIDSEGQVWTWGNGLFTPAQVSGLNNIIAVSTGNGFYLALDSDHLVWAWGANSYGQLGLGDTVMHASPTRITSLSNINQISAGSYHSMALDSSGNVWAWGNNAVGQLGLDSHDLNPHATPTQITSLSGMAAISAGAADYYGYDHSLALTSGGSVYAWGANNFGQLGKDPDSTDHVNIWGTIYSYKATPLLVAGLSNIDKIAAGGGYNLVIDSSQNVWSWGAAGNGELGNGTTDPVIQPTPGKVVGNGGSDYLENITSVCAGRGEYSDLSLATDSSGNAWAWGAAGRLGNGTSDGSAIPVQVDLPDVSAVTAGTSWGVAISTTSSAPSTTTLESTPNPSTFGEMVDITITVSGEGEVTPTGIASLSIELDSPVTQEAELDGLGQAVFPDIVLPPGDVNITATYYGNVHYLPSTNSISHTINLIKPEATLSLEDTESGNFGRAVDIDGDYAVVGAPLKNSYAGAAYVYHRSGGLWEQLVELTASDTEPGDCFGGAVAIRGDTIVIGAPEKNYTLNEVNTDGLAYVFKRSENSWTQQAVLTPAVRTEGDHFGQAVDIDGNIIVVGAPIYTINDYYSCGAAFIFKANGDAWQEEAMLAATDVNEDDNFGCSVAISGDTVAAGAEHKEPDGGGGYGAAYVFILSGDTWSQQAKLTTVATYDDNLGHSVAIDGDMIAVGNPNKDLFDASYTGAVDVFTRTDTNWTLEDELVAGDHRSEDYFGSSISIYGNGIIAGAPYHGLPDAYQTGTAYFFTHAGEEWIQQYELAVVTPSTNDYFGFAIGFDGSRAIIGAYGENDERGTAYIFSILPVGNHAPVAVNDEYATNEDTPLEISAPGVLNNDTDEDGNPLTAIKLTDPAHGTLTLNVNGSFSYHPATDYNGSDSFTYKANDSEADSNTATVSISINPIEVLEVETSIGEQKDIDQVVLLSVSVTRVVDPSTQDTVPGVPIASYSASLTFTPVFMEILGVRGGDPPFDTIPPENIIIDNVAGTASVSYNVSPSGSLPYIIIFRIVARLNDSCLVNGNLSVNIVEVSDPGGMIMSTQDQPMALTFQRGDVQVPQNGTVNITDAMFGAQYVVGIRTAATVRMLNLASVRHDGTAGDKINITDCMFIAQKVVGIRNEDFELTGQ